MCDTHLGHIYSSSIRDPSSCIFYLVQYLLGRWPALFYVVLDYQAHLLLVFDHPTLLSVSACAGFTPVIYVYETE